MLAGCLVLGAVLLFVLASRVFAPYDPLAQNVAERLQPPSPRHWFGTDAFGRDVLTRMGHGGLVSLSIAAVAVCLGGVVGASGGLAAGMGSGFLDRVLVGIINVLQSIPTLLLALLIATILGGGVTSIVLSIAATNVALFARLVRGEALRLRHEPYVESARAVGASRLRVARRHVVPNLRSVVLVALTMRLSTAILLEAALSYLGLGISPPAPTWGNMVLEGQRYLELAVWLSVAPGLAIMATVLGLNVFGDGLRDALDPRLRQGLAAPAARPD
jgi:peptide/nickel transport system permease protein